MSPRLCRTHPHATPADYYHTTATIMQASQAKQAISQSSKRARTHASKQHKGATRRVYQYFEYCARPSVEGVNLVTEILGARGGSDYLHESCTHMLCEWAKAVQAGVPIEKLRSRGRHEYNPTTGGAASVGTTQSPASSRQAFMRPNDETRRITSGEGPSRPKKSRRESQGATQLG